MHGTVLRSVIAAAVIAAAAVTPALGAGGSPPSSDATAIFEPGQAPVKNSYPPPPLPAEVAGSSSRSS